MSKTPHTKQSIFRNMPAVSLSFTVEQLKWLKRESYRLEISMAEFMRRLVDDVRLKEE